MAGQDEVDRFCPERVIAEERADKSGELGRVEVDEGAGLEEVGDVGHRRFKEFREVAELEPEWDETNNE